MTMEAQTASVVSAGQLCAMGMANCVADVTVAVGPERSGQMPAMLNVLGMTSEMKKLPSPDSTTFPEVGSRRETVPVQVPTKGGAWSTPGFGPASVPASVPSLLLPLQAHTNAAA